MSEIALRVEGLSKRYRLGLEQSSAGSFYRYKSLRDSFGGFARQPVKSLRAAVVRHPMNEQNSFWALKDLDFEVKRGEVVGIIGRNGAGKSTLLKILSRITKPTTGHVALYGRVGSLLEVGTGFHPELTGRENIYLNGAILGMTKAEIRKQFDEIVAFSEIEKFLDTAVKQYSSGMYMRLAFAVAAHLEPEILVVDEVLAVGDAEFQKKCLGKMKDVAEHGRTVLFVSHNMTAVAQLCKTGVLLSHGKITELGDIQKVILKYQGPHDSKNGSIWNRTDKSFDSDVLIPLRLAVVDEGGQAVNTAIRNDLQYWLEVDVDVRRASGDLEIGYCVSTGDGNLLYWSFHTDETVERWPKISAGVIRLRTPWPQRLLNEGGYHVELLAAIHQQYWLLEGGRNAPSILVEVEGGLSESPHFNHRRKGSLAPVFSWSARLDEL